MLNLPLHLSSWYEFESNSNDSLKQFLRGLKKILLFFRQICNDGVNDKNERKIPKTSYPTTHCIKLSVSESHV